MKFPVALAVVAAVFNMASSAATLQVQTAGRTGNLTWTGAFTAGVCTVETSLTPGSPWTVRTNHFTSNTVGSSRISLTSSNTFCRLLAVDISTNTPRHYTNLLESYGILETVAGSGQSQTDTSHWLPSYEGEWATNVSLSRPHISFGDPWGNVLIVDQRSSSVLKVRPDGRLHTYAGTHNTNFNGDGPAFATNLNLCFPNGGWIRADGTFYVLDTANAKVRRIDTNQMMTTLFTAPSPLGDGRALWVKSDESLIYFGSGTSSNETDVGATSTILKKWTPAGGVSVVRTGFAELGNIVGDERNGDLYITDRLGYRIYRLDTNGVMTTFAGNGTATGSGGEGFYATNTSLNVPRSIWFIPNGGYFITEHDPGNRIWYVDPAGIIHRWMNGSSANNFRVGDGQWFYANPAAAKLSRVRSANTDPFGNLIITESNYGYVRRIRFGRLNP
ncbi:MAG: hypothetical protein QOF48_3265 [Verrucomicrobiota bacterium]|jgi:hypothetical protein